MRLVGLALFFGVVAAIWQYGDGGAAWLIFLVATIAYGATRAAAAPGPKKPGTHRWVPMIGLGVGPFGFLPFLTITRRPRR